jgi:hypothetical protein
MTNTPPLAGGALEETAGEDVVTSITPATDDQSQRRADDASAPRLTRAEFVSRLLDLGRRYGPLPIYGSAEWEALDPVDPRRFAAVVVAAECWRSDGTDDAIRARLEQELAEQNRLCAWRLRRLSGDLSEAEDWAEMAASVDRSRRARGVRDTGYQEVTR